MQAEVVHTIEAPDQTALGIYYTVEQRGVLNPEWFRALGIPYKINTLEDAKAYAEDYVRRRPKREVRVLKWDARVEKQKKERVYNPCGVDKCVNDARAGIFFEGRWLALCEWHLQGEGAV